jgi:hypothetical protein
MGNFDQIKDVVLTYADQYAQAFRQGAPVDTGRLRNSYRASVSEKDGSFTMQIFGEFYGPFQSYGVGPGRPALEVPDGVNPPPRSGRTYKFQNPNRYIPPTNFMGNAITTITPKFGQALEDAGVKDVENFFDSLSKIEVK